MTITVWTPLLAISVLTATSVAAQPTSSDADSATRKGQAASLRVLPVLGSAPETGFVGGATLLRVSTPAGDSTRPSADQLYVSYTVKHQFRAFVSTDRWTVGNRRGWSAQLEYQLYPQPYFGVGIDTPESAEEWYEARSISTSVAVRQRLTGPLFVQLGHRFTNTAIRDAAPGGAIASADLPGMRGGVVSQVMSGVAWDTRDNIFAPAAGTFAQVTGAWSASALGSDFSFGRYVGDARRYLKLGRGVLAGQAYVEASTGRAPFDQLSLLGSGSVMRGYVRGRYRDRDLLAAQIEYRLPVTGKLGIAGFAGAGTVAPTPSKLASSTLLPSFGAGARWLLIPKSRTTVRVDYGIGKGSSGLYVAFNEAY